MSNKSELVTVLKQTRDQLIAPVEFAFYGIKNFIVEIPERRAIKISLENLTDPTLLDRMSRAPKPIDIQDDPRPVRIPVRVLRRPLSIDGIMRPAA